MLRREESGYTTQNIYMKKAHLLSLIWLISVVHSLCKYINCNWGYFSCIFIFWRVQLLMILFVHHFLCWHFFVFCFWFLVFGFYLSFKYTILILIFNSQIMLIWNDKLLGLYNIQNIEKGPIEFFQLECSTLKDQMKSKSIGVKEKLTKIFWY